MRENVELYSGLAEARFVFYFFIFLSTEYAIKEMYPKRILAKRILITVFVLSSGD
jgi:hypothetical protein